MKKIIFIVNPVAGNGKTSDFIPYIKDHFNKIRDIEYKIVVTQRVGHAEIIARDSVKEGYNYVISVGGDGTTYEIINGIGDNKDVCLGLIPSGTGNDFVRMLNIETTDIDILLETIEKGLYIEADIGFVNSRMFINYCSTGFDTMVVEESRKIKEFIAGPPAYAIGVLKSLKRHMGTKVKITIDGVEYNRKVDLIAVNNGKYFGGGMMINPDASIDDGLFDICLVNSISKVKFLFLFLTVFKGAHIKLECVETFKGKNIVIETEDIWNINADGDYVGKTPASIYMTNSKIKVLVSEKQHEFAKVMDSAV